MRFLFPPPPPQGVHLALLKDLKWKVKGIGYWAELLLDLGGFFEKSPAMSDIQTAQVPGLESGSLP